MLPPTLSILQRSMVRVHVNMFPVHIMFELEQAKTDRCQLQLHYGV